MSKLIDRVMDAAHDYYTHLEPLALHQLDTWGVDVHDDTGGISTEGAAYAAGLVVVAGVVIAIITTKGTSNANNIPDTLPGGGG